MDLSGIISINGMPGLYKVVANSKSGVIVESLTEKKRFPVFGASKISALEDISMFAESGDKPLSEIMKSVFDKEKGGKAIDHKADDKAVEAYFAEILPDYDKERVYVSNMRKLFNWYNLMQETGNLKEVEEEKEGETKKPKLTAEEKKKVAAAGAKKDTGKVKTAAGNRKTTGVRKAGTA
ncbi:MAG: hypothetical protein K0S33_2619 [Bacteroidetes bacterium]|jgi:hypothetical protein|nr:hypothetical protein [Bacteroidota bacterium]